MPDLPLPRYSLWQAVGIALGLATRAIEEVRAGGKPGPQGEPGPPGAEPYVGEVCGLYEPERQYRKYDLVTFRDSEWRARCDEPGELPGDGWAVSARAGSRGKPGEKGDRGVPGAPAPTIARWETRDYRAVPVMSDGSVGPPLDLREFFELYHAERAA